MKRFESVEVPTAGPRPRPRGLHATAVTARFLLGEPPRHHPGPYAFRHDRLFCAGLARSSRWPASEGMWGRCRSPRRAGVLQSSRIATRTAAYPKPCPPQPARRGHPEPTRVCPQVEDRSGATPLLFRSVSRGALGFGKDRALLRKDFGGDRLISTGESADLHGTTSGP